MSGLGHLLLDCGFQVSGSDLVLGAEVEGLCSRGARIFQGHHETNLSENKPVLAAFSSAIKSDNPEIQAVLKQGIPLAHRATLLAALAGHGPSHSSSLGLQNGQELKNQAASLQRKLVCIAGMHGKTTTTAWLSYALMKLGAAPGYAIGALVPQMERHAGMGGWMSLSPDALEKDRKGDALFIAEADESDGSFQVFQPEQAIILNLDNDHLDHFGDFSGVCREFEAFASRVRAKIFYCADDEHAQRLFGSRANAISFGYAPSADYRIERVSIPEGQAKSGPMDGKGFQSFNLWHRERLLGLFHTSLIGQKNLLNGAAVAALLHQAGFEPSKIADAMSLFRGAARRQQPLLITGKCRIYDDYGHHPREISATLQAFKEYVPGRLLVAFQAHRYTRTQLLLDQFATCFARQTCCGSRRFILPPSRLCPVLPDKRWPMQLKKRVKKSFLKPGLRNYGSPFVITCALAMWFYSWGQGISRMQRICLPKR